MGIFIYEVGFWLSEKAINVFFMLFHGFIRLFMGLLGLFNCLLGCLSVIRGY